MKTNSKDLREQLKCFINFTRDFERYLELKEKIKIHSSINQVCKEIEPSVIIRIILNDKAEEIAREKEEKRQHKKVRPKPVIYYLDDEDNLSPHSKLYQCRRAINPTCFGQRSMESSLHFFSGKEEMKIMSQVIKQKIKQVIKGSFYFASSDRGGNYIKEAQYIMSSQARREVKKEKDKCRFLNPLFNEPNCDLNKIRILANDNILNSYKESLLKKQNKDKDDIVKRERKANENKFVIQKDEYSNKNKKLYLSHIEYNMNVEKLIKTSTKWSSEKRLDKALFGIKKNNKLLNEMNPSIGKHFDYTKLFSIRIMK